VISIRGVTLPVKALPNYGVCQSLGTVCEHAEMQRNVTLFVHGVEHEREMLHQQLDNSHMDVVQERRVQQTVLSVVAVQLGHIPRRRLAGQDDVFDEIKIG